MPATEEVKGRNIFKREVKKEKEEAYEEEDEEGGEGNPRDIEIDIASHGERPSVRAKLSLAAKAGVSTRPRIPHDPPCFYRVYFLTSQRVPLELPQLNSAAAYLLINDEENRVVIWLGSTCSDSDITYAKELGLEVFRRDMRNYDATEIDDIIWEGRESEQPELLKYIVDECGSDEGTYRGKKTIAERRNEIENEPISMRLLDKMPDGILELIEVGYAAPNDFGTILRIPFAPISIDSIVVSHIGNQWDMWIARGNTPEQEMDGKAFVTTLAATRQGKAAASVSTNIRIIRQGCERVTYRRYFKVLTDFEPPGRTVPWATPTPKKENLEKRHLKSKIMQLDTERDEDYGQPIEDHSFDFNEEMVAPPSISPPSRSPHPLNTPSISPLPLNLPVPPPQVEFENSPFPRISTPGKPQLTGRDDAPLTGRDDDPFTGRDYGPLTGRNNRSDSWVYSPPQLDDDNHSQDSKTSDFIPVQHDVEQRAPFDQPDGIPPSIYIIPASDIYNVGGDGSPRPTDATDENTPPGVNKQLGDDAGKNKLTLGRDMITRDMIRFHDGESITPEQRQLLYTEAGGEPNVLLGWQVEVDEGRLNGLHVITGTKKTFFRKPVYRLSSFESDDVWATLKLRPKTTGVQFRALRKVF